MIPENSPFALSMSVLLSWSVVVGNTASLVLVNLADILELELELAAVLTSFRLLLLILLLTPSPFTSYAFVVDSHAVGLKTN